MMPSTITRLGAAFALSGALLMPAAANDAPPSPPPAQGDTAPDVQDDTFKPDIDDGLKFDPDLEPREKERPTPKYIPARDFKIQACTRDLRMVSLSIRVMLDRDWVVATQRDAVEEKLEAIGAEMKDVVGSIIGQYDRSYVTGAGNSLYFEMRTLTQKHAETFRRTHGVDSQSRFSPITPQPQVDWECR